MDQWPIEINRFMQRDTPVFTHMAAARKGAAPFSCRGYGYWLEKDRGIMWIYILKSQWLRLKAYMQEETGNGIADQPEPERERVLAALFTSGIDNESYQVKGPYAEYRLLTALDTEVIGEQRSRVSRHTPGLLRLMGVSPADCLAVGIMVRAVYVQTPGPDAGSLIREWGEKPC